MTSKPPDASQSRKSGAPAGPIRRTTAFAVGVAMCEVSANPQLYVHSWPGGKADTGPPGRRTDVAWGRTSGRLAFPTRGVSAHGCATPESCPGPRLADRH